MRGRDRDTETNIETEREKEVNCPRGMEGEGWKDNWEHWWQKKYTDEH